jgi:putative ABC transport system substrate-binding protein
MKRTSLPLQRREFITLLGGAMASWPLGVRAQQDDRVRRIGVLMPDVANNPQVEVRNGALVKELERLGWTVGRNLKIDYRWSASVLEETRELVALAPDVIFASGSATLRPLLQATRTIPIVFAIVPDPVGAGFVSSLAKPGGNATGFMTFEPSITAKWLELLKQFAPGVKYAAVLRDPTITAGIGQWSAIQAIAPTLSVELRPIDVRNASEIGRSITEFARIPNGGMIVTGSGLAVTHRDLIIKLAAQFGLPTIYYERFYSSSGGLVSYGPDFVDQYRQAAGYVDRILKGEKPGDLPVQAPTKYELVINLKTAKALGLEVPPTLLARADEVIE